LEVKPAAAAALTSVTGLIAYATCPRSFYWSEVDRLPRRPNPAARRGTEVHRLIELHHRGQMAFDDLDSSTYDMPPGEGPSSDQAGPDALSAFFASRFASERPWLVEAPFEMPVGALTVRGRIDAIYRIAEAWEIVDFKSGRGDGAPFEPSDPRWVQLQAYALAAMGGSVAPSSPPNLEVTFVYLGGGLEEVTRRVDEDWLQAARSRIEELTLGISEGNFEPAPSSACRGCDFLTFCPAGREFLST
jgi:RecB family exonuclease